MSKKDRNPNQPEERQPTAPETDKITENMKAWDDEPGATGKQAPTMAPDDEISLPQMLAEEGTEIADTELRSVYREETDETEEEDL